MDKFSIVRDDLVQFHCNMALIIFDFCVSIYHL